MESETGPHHVVRWHQSLVVHEEFAQRSEGHGHTAVAVVGHALTQARVPLEAVQPEVTIHQDNHQQQVVALQAGDRMDDHRLAWSHVIQRAGNQTDLLVEWLMSLGRVHQWVHAIRDPVGCGRRRAEALVLAQWEILRGVPH